MGSNIRAIEVSNTGSTSLSDDTSNREIMEIQGAAPSILTSRPCLMHVCCTTCWHRASLTYGTSRPKRYLFHKDKELPLNSHLSYTARAINIILC